MIRGPTDQQRTVVLGRTGTGKTQFSCSLFSTRNFNEIPWIIIDYKGDDLIIEIVEACKGAIKPIAPTDKVPTEPGIYYMKLQPVFDDAAIDDFLRRVHKQGNCGLYIDEGFTLPQMARGSFFNVILTQGRSLHIPVIVLYQRAAWMSRFAVAQADFFAAFAQNDERDIRTCKQFIKPFKGDNGLVISIEDELPDYHCFWFDVGKGKTSILKPAPSREEIINTFVQRLRPRKKRNFI